MDMQSDRVTELLSDKRFHFFEGDITINREWIEYHIKKCDTVLPLVAIATPATYVKEPLRVFELDFEANLPIVRACVRYGKRIIFPSTSEVYGMCRDDEFDPERSELVLGPINKPRWIYSCAKQLMDRVIHAYGMQQGLDYTLFRPFNWIGSGPRLDQHGEGRQLARHHAVPRAHRPRRADQARRRRHAEARVHLHRRRHRRADEDHRQPRRHRDGQDLQHRQPGQQLLGARARDDDARPGAHLPEYRDTAERVRIVETTADQYYGTGYQDVQNRVPKIDQHLRRPRLAAAGRDGRGAARASSTPTAGRWPRRGASSSSRRRGPDAARAQDRRRHAARHARGRAEPRHAAARSTAPTRRSSSRSAPITRAARSSACSGPDSSARCAAPRSSATTA